MACNFVSGGDSGVDGLSTAVSVSWRRRWFVEDASCAHYPGRSLGRIVCDSHGELQIGLDWIARASLISDAPKNKGGIKAAFSMGRLFSRLKHVDDDEEAQPHYVNKMPVPRCGLKGEMMLVVEVAAH